MASAAAPLLAATAPAEVMSVGVMAAAVVEAMACQLRRKAVGRRLRDGAAAATAAAAGDVVVVFEAGSIISV